MSDSGPGKGFGDAIDESEGHPLVVVGLNFVLSATFGWMVVWGLAYLGFMAYSAVNVATAAILVFALTYVMVLR